MTTFKIDQRTDPLYGREFPEYTKFRRYQGYVLYIPLLIGENQVKFFALCNLSEVKEVKSPFDSGLVYDKPELPPRAIVVWKPVLVLSPDMAAQVNHAIGVEVRIAA